MATTISGSTPVTVAISASTSGAGNTLITAPAAGYHIEVLALSFIAASALNVTFFSGTDALTGALPVPANGGVVWGNGSSPVLICGNNKALNVTLGSAVLIAGFVTYVVEEN